MHNCKALRETLLEMALNKVLLDQNQSVCAELEQCVACREEYASLRNALRVADQAMQYWLPAENFWPEYNARLRKRLESDSEIVASRYPAPECKAGISGWVRKLVTASVTVPVPLASAVVVLFVLSILFPVYSRRTLSGAPATNSPSVITKIVEVPVIREKPVTRVVYIERDRHSARVMATRREVERNARTSVVGRRNQADRSTPESLAGFKPANDVKLTIIKGSYRNDK